MDLCDKNGSNSIWSKMEKSGGQMELSKNFQNAQLDLIGNSSIDILRSTGNGCKSRNLKFPTESSGVGWVSGLASLAFVKISLQFKQTLREVNRIC